MKGVNSTSIMKGEIRWRIERGGLAFSSAAKAAQRMDQMFSMFTGTYESYYCPTEWTLDRAATVPVTNEIKYLNLSTSFS
jgi:hypothetical protein